MRRISKVDIQPLRQRSQFTCVSASTCMALNALGVVCDEDSVNKILGAHSGRGASWEQALACIQYFGCRGTLVTPSTLAQVKSWTDAGKPVLIGWNPYGREWAHASVVYHVEGEEGNQTVHVADPNLPNPNKTTVAMSEDDFYERWMEPYNGYLIRRPAMMVDREITPQGRQVMASRIASQFI